jgi:hypothetical protein
MQMFSAESNVSYDCDSFLYSLFFSGINNYCISMTSTQSARQSVDCMFFL